MKLTKRSWQELVPGSFAQVIAHAAWRRSRGKEPSMSYRGIRNPRKALAAAEKQRSISRLGRSDFYVHTSRLGTLDLSDRQVRAMLA